MLRAPLRGRQSPNRFIRSRLDIKSWAALGVPDIDLVRPRRCPACDSASRAPGGGLVLHGHGLRERQLRGPPEPGFLPKIMGIILRRYACQACRAVVVVGPGEVLPRRSFTGSSIAWALALFGVSKLSPPQVRKLVSPQTRVGFTAASSWASLLRWARAGREARLFPGVRRCPRSLTLRQVAAHAAQSIAARCPPERHGALEHQAFFGAARAMASTPCADADM